jgi:hypothetical protein
LVQGDLSFSESIPAAVNRQAVNATFFAAV